jgi:hypothetical protein
MKAPLVPEPSSRETTLIASLVSKSEAAVSSAVLVSAAVVSAVVLESAVLSVVVSAAVSVAVLSAPQQPVIASVPTVSAPININTDNFFISFFLHVLHFIFHFFLLLFCRLL